MVHSSVASLFNLEYISTSMLWNCFHFSLPCQFTTSRFISSHTWKSCTPEHAMIATAVIFSLTFKPFSIFFYPLNCSFPNFFFALLTLSHTSVHTLEVTALLSSLTVPNALSVQAAQALWHGQGCDWWHQQPGLIFCWAAGPPAIQRWLHQPPLQYPHDFQRINDNFLFSHGQFWPIFPNE